ncbi:MAG: DapH/DapD/GlmU-related protein [Candidatus Omnitrophota bacterium]
MLIAAFEPIEVAPGTVKFRGRDSFFWKREIFRLALFDPDTEGKNNFDFLIIFDPNLFLAIEPDGIDEILNDLRHRDPEKDTIISIEGKPFFAISYGAYLKLKLQPKGDGELLSKLRNNGNVRITTLKSPFDVLDMRYVEIIEKMVVAHQLHRLIRNGVTVDDFGHFYIEGFVPIGTGSQLGSGVVIKGETTIGKNVHIYPHSFIENSIIGDDCTVLPGSIIIDSKLEENVRIGPYTHLRNGSVVKKGAKMGNFVEMKKSVLGEGSKSMHLTYIGDAEIGQHVNIGAGTITCNYDGVNKNKTIIQDHVFIGSGTELVAPVTVKKNSYVAAGSTITQDVPEDALGIAREKQRNIVGWVTKKKRQPKTVG